MRHLFSLLLISVLSGSLWAQPCLSDHLLEKRLKEHPELAAEYARFERIDQFAPANQAEANAPRIIPVVFHVVHMYGSENISKAQILDQMRILNEDFKKLNADTTNIDPTFKSVAADCNIEFRLAQIDPNGNCTDGIVRVYSPLCENARDNVKAVSYWNSQKYLNVWVVKSIESSSGGEGTVLGFAQFPGPFGGGTSTDGVVVRADYIGSIGSGSPSYKGRTLTHEIGHWLGLFHTFQGGCNINGDQVSDTPPVANPSYGCTRKNSCTNDVPDKTDQIENYMDYSNGNCQGMFSIGQKSRMDGVFTQYRSQLISATNLAETGVDGNGPTACAPIPDFVSYYTSICEGASFNFYDASYNSIPTAWTWTFAGGNPSGSTLQNPTGIVYSTSGSFAVTLKSENANGNNSVTKNAYLNVYPLVATTKAPFSQGFESSAFPSNGWQLENLQGNTWTRVTTVSKSGSACYRINHFSGTFDGEIDAFTSPQYDLSNLNTPSLSFYTAHAQRSTTISDVLRCYVSVDCGKTWNLRWSKAGSNLAGGTVVTSTAFVPNSTQWRLQTLDLAAYKGNKNVRFKYETTGRSGNNIYIDDINVFDASPSGIDAPNMANNVLLFPNPVQNTLSIQFALNTNTTIGISIVDLLGRELVFESNRQMEAGVYTIQVPSDLISNLNAGVYFIRIETNGLPQVVKFVKQ